MKCSSKYCALILVVILMMIMTIATFAGTLGLAIVGIIKADEDNVCSTSNKTVNCLPQMTLLTSSSNGTPSTENQRRIIDGEDENEFAYWLAGATGCGVLFAIFATFSLWALEEAVCSSRVDGRKPQAEETELERMGESATCDEEETETEPTPPIDDTIDDHDVSSRTKAPLRKLDCCSIFVLFFGCLTATLSLLTILWSIAIAFNHAHRVVITVRPFVLVELLAGVVFPALFFSSVVAIMNVLDFVTVGAVDARKALPRFLPSVQIKKGEKYDWWIIQGSFYFSLKQRKKEDRPNHGFCFTCFPNTATWILVAIVFVTINFAISYFFDVAIDTQRSVTSCNDPLIDRDFSCFNRSTLNFVDCINDTQVELIHCFKFYRFGVEVDLISAFAKTYAIYLFATTIFGHTFLVMKVLTHVSKQRFWGVLFIVAGVILLFGFVGVIILWLTDYISAITPELSRVNIINLAQFVMVAMFVLLVGLLIFSGHWKESKPKPKSTKGTEQEKTKGTEQEKKKTQ